MTAARQSMTKARAHRLEALTHAPGWADLIKEADAAEQRYAQLMLARVKRGEAIDQREADYMRGKFDALRTILKQPIRAVTFLDKLEAEEAESSEE